MGGVLITGANGHIGANLVRELLGRGVEDIRPMVRPTSDLRGLDGLDVTPVHGDVMDPQRVAELAAGCDVIVNLAAVYSLTSRNLDRIMAPAIAGIEGVLRAAAQHGVRRVVHISSVVAVGPSDHPTKVRGPGDWNEDGVLPYHLAKTRSEQRAWELAKELGVELICINPGGILGPYDFKPTPSMGYLAEMANGTAQTLEGGFNYVDVRDVAWLIAEAMTRGEPGQRYLCGGENLDLKTWAAMTTEITGRKVTHVGLPRWVMLLLGKVVGGAFKLIGAKPPLDYEGVYQLAHRWLYADISATVEAFGFAPRDGETQVRDALRWLAEAGMLEAAVAQRVREEVPESGW